MNPTTIILIVITLLVVIGLLAWLVYKAGFRATEMTVKAGLVETKMERTPGDKPAAADDTAPPAPRTEASQEALDGGQIDESTIRAPADSGAKLQQKAKGPDSRISGGEIELR